MPRFFRVGAVDSGILFVRNLQAGGSLDYPLPSERLSTGVILLWSCHRFPHCWWILLVWNTVISTKWYATGFMMLPPFVACLTVMLWF
jgi:hypothetical protein